MSGFLTGLEQLDIEASIVRSTKIHKVMKGIIKLPPIPLDEVYHIRTRSARLLGKWNVMLAEKHMSVCRRGDYKIQEEQGEPVASSADTRDAMLDPTCERDNLVLPDCQSHDDSMNRATDPDSDDLPEIERLRIQIDYNSWRTNC